MEESSRDKLCFNINGIIYWIDKEAYELEQRYLNDIKFRQEMEEKYKGQYVSPIKPLDEFLILTKDEEGYFTGLESFEIKEKLKESVRIEGDLDGTATVILEPDNDLLLHFKILRIFKPHKYKIEVR